jgi:trehalose 6-phosphate phosphatase
VRQLLEQVNRRYALVACISGRRALDARRIVGLDSIAYVGNHGLELLEPGASEATTDPALEPLASAVRAFARSEYDSDLEALGVRLEDKDAIWSYHWRGAPDERAAREALRRIASDADREGLVPHWGRTALDGRPLGRALYAGDDTTDLDAFRKLRALQAAGQIEALCVGVRSHEGPEAIEQEADLVVDGPEGVAELLGALA